MRKLAMQVGDDIHEEKPRSRLPAVLMILLLLVGLAPLANEGVALCISSWKEYMGIPATVRTPVLDYLAEKLETAQSSLRDQVSPVFHRIPWDPKMVLSVGALVMAVAMLMLRR
jgi:hypothetical protein